jgi:hypothetical protein
LCFQRVAEIPRTHALALGDLLLIGQRSEQTRSLRQQHARAGFLAESLVSERQAELGQGILRA